VEEDLKATPDRRIKKPRRRRRRRRRSWRRWSIRNSRECLLFYL